MGFLLISIAHSAKAEELDFGEAMHGSPKHSVTDTHLSYANPDAPKGGTIKHAAIGTFDTLNPFSIKGKAAEGLNLYYDRLMGRSWDEPFTMYPLIAQRVDMTEDRSAMTIHIDPNARFHDQSRITADDVIFSLETLMDEGRPNMRQVYRLIETFEKRNDLTVHLEFGLGHDRETAMVVLLMPILSKSDWQGKTFHDTTMEPPLGSGPYRIASVDPGRQIIYERVPDYWADKHLTNAGHHNFDTIIYDYYRDDNVAFEAFKSGDVTFRRENDVGRWASAYNFPALTEGKVMKKALPHGRPEKAKGYIFNTRRAPFDDIRVREALNLIFDFEWANENLFYGRYKRINSIYPNSELAAADLPPQPTHENRQQSRQNMRKASQLLEQAGWSVENGKRMKDGQALTFEILLSDPQDEKITLHFKKSLERMGIAANIRVLDAASYLRRLQDYDFDITLYHWLSSLSPGTEQMVYWGCEAAEQKGRFNYAGICDPEIDALAKSMADAKTREELLNAAHALDRKIMAGTYFIPLYYAGEDYFAYWKPITPPETTPLYGAVVESWWAKEQP